MRMQLLSILSVQETRHQEINKRGSCMHKWSNTWTDPRNNKFRIIKDSILPWCSVFCMSLREEVDLCRLRIGHIVPRLAH